jgi:hypothetical protein
MTDEEIEAAVNKGYGKGYRVKILEIIRRKELVLVRYRVKADRDGCIEWRVKGWGTKAMSGWDFPYRRRF